MSCEDPIEKLYYSTKFADICVYCGCAVDPWSNKEPYYPQCEECREKPPLLMPRSHVQFLSREASMQPVCSAHHTGMPEL